MTFAARTPGRGLIATIQTPLVLAHTDSFDICAARLA
jgi:hypothetical protein